MTKQMICKECGGRFFVGYGADNGGEDLCEACVERRESDKEDDGFRDTSPADPFLQFILDTCAEGKRA